MQQQGYHLIIPGAATELVMSVSLKGNYIAQINPDTSSVLHFWQK